MTTTVGVMLAVAIAALTAPHAVGGQATPRAEPAMIPPVVWELRSIATLGEAIGVAEGAPYTVQFLPEGELRLLADCNRGTGEYRLAGDTIEAGPFATTRMGCGPDSLDGAFLVLLEAADRSSFVDDALVLEGAAGSLTFVPRLTDVAWAWQGFQESDGGAVVPADPDAYRIGFRGDGRFDLRVDCNGGGGRYQSDPPAISLEVAVLTEAVCDDPDLDRTFLRIVEEGNSFVFRGGDLYLALPLDTGIAHFTARFVEPETEASPAAG